MRRAVLASVVAAVPEAARFSASFPFDAAAAGSGSKDGDEDDDDDDDDDEEGEEGQGGGAAAAAASSSSNGNKPLPPRFVLQGTMESPIRGATSGNVEYLAHFKRVKS